MTIRELTRKYRKAGTYAELIREVIAHNTEKVARGLGRLSEARYRRSADRALGSGVMVLPRWDEVVPKRAVWLKKSMESGEVISETLRNRLTAAMRQELVDWRGEAGAAPGRVPPELLRRLEARVAAEMRSYTAPSTPARQSNARAIAVTEVRSAVDEVKFEYAKRMALANTERLSVRKRWKHNDSLVRKPRPGHKALDGATVGLHESFTVQTPRGPVQMMHPHDPMAPAGEVIGCQCDYDVVVSELPGYAAKSRRAEALAAVGLAAADLVAVRKDSKPVPKVGERVTRPDGTVWEKTGTYSYKKVTDGGVESPIEDMFKGVPGADLKAKRESVKREFGLTDEELDKFVDETLKGKTSEPAAPAGFVRTVDDEMELALKEHEKALELKVRRLVDDLSKPGGLPVKDVKGRRDDIKFEHALTDDELDAKISEAIKRRMDAIYGPSEDKPAGYAAPAASLDMTKVRGLATSMGAPMSTALRAHESMGLPVGTRRVWGGIEWIKTADGWKRVRYVVRGSFEDAASEAVDDPEKLAAFREYLETEPFTPEHDAALAALKDKYGEGDWADDLEDMSDAWDKSKSKEPSPEDLLRADPDYMRYVESSDDSEARMRLDLKKALGARYGIDPYMVVAMKKDDKEAEAKAVPSVPGTGEDGEPEDLSEMGPVSLKGALERDGMVTAMLKDLKAESVSDLTTEEIRGWMSKRYTLFPVPAETSTPASKRLAAAYEADPSARLALRPGSSAPDREDVDPGERSWWTPEFKVKLNKVLRNNAPRESLGGLTSAPHVSKVFGSPAAAERFVSDVDKMVSGNPVTMRFHIRDVAKHWAKEPRTKNLFETGTGHGSTSKTARSGWEYKIIDYSSSSKGRVLHDEMLATERPSYAMIGHKESFLASAGEGYGQSTLVLKDEVKVRCTFTLGNSSGEVGAFVAGGASKLLEKDRASMLSSNKANKARCVDSKFTYLETQVWGGVDISRDVDHIVVSGREWERSSKADQDSMRAVADRCGVEIRYRDGEVLYSPRSGAKLETPAADLEKVKAALAVPVGTIKRDMGPDGSRVYKVKTSKFTWALCDEDGRKLGGPPVKAPSKWAVTWHAVKPEEAAPDPAPASTKAGSKDTYTKGGKVYLRHDSAVPVGGVEVRADGSKYVRTSKFTWRKL